MVFESEEMFSGQLSVIEVRHPNDLTFPYSIHLTNLIEVHLLVLRSSNFHSL